MSYTPTNWKSGDVVTSAKLNKIEQGIANGGILVCTMDEQTSALDKTYAEIASAGFAVLQYVMRNGMTSVVPLTMFGPMEDKYALLFGEESDGDMYVADSEDGYPAPYSEDDGGGGEQS